MQKHKIPPVPPDAFSLPALLPFPSVSQNLMDLPKLSRTPNIILNGKSVLGMANFGSVIVVQYRATLNCLDIRREEYIGVQECNFFDRKADFSEVVRGGMSSSAGLGDAACVLTEQREIAPRSEILHPEALCALGQQKALKGFGEKSWHWAAVAAGTLTALLCHTDGEPQLASTVIDTIMAGLPGPRGAPGPVGPPGNKLSRAANL